MLFMCLASSSDSIYRVKIYATPDIYSPWSQVKSHFRNVLLESQFVWNECNQFWCSCSDRMRILLTFFPSQQAATKKPIVIYVFRSKSIWMLTVILPLLLSHDGFEMKQSRCDLGVFSYTWSILTFHFCMTITKWGVYCFEMLCQAITAAAFSIWNTWCVGRSGDWFGHWRISSLSAFSRCRLPLMVIKHLQCKVLSVLQYLA